MSWSRGCKITSCAELHVEHGACLSCSPSPTLTTSPSHSCIYSLCKRKKELQCSWLCSLNENHLFRLQPKEKSKSPIKWMSQTGAKTKHKVNEILYRQSQVPWLPSLASSFECSTSKLQGDRKPGFIQVGVLLSSTGRCKNCQRKNGLVSVLPYVHGLLWSRIIEWL